MAVYDPAESSSEQPPKWQDKDWIKRIAGNTKFVIVMVADPEETGDTLRYDRTIEAIQNVTDVLPNLSFAGYWIPWQEKKESPGTYTANADNRNLEEPGIIVYRRKDGKILAAFLVGESAISGIRRLQFNNAVSHIIALSNPSLEKIQIAGPNYSGSFGPLRTAIDQESKRINGIKTFRVISPSATLKSAFNNFRHEIATDGKPEIQYNSMVHNYLNCQRGEGRHRYHTERNSPRSEDKHIPETIQSCFWIAETATGQDSRVAGRYGNPDCKGIGAGLGKKPFYREQGVFGQERRI
jgi:hypothetical protein